MDFSGLKIGYWPISKFPGQPTDTRNFLYYAKKRNIEFEIADPAKNYDVVVLSPRSDLTVWKSYPRNRGKIIFLTVDSYLAIPKSNIKGHLRGLAKWAAQEHKNLRFNYSGALQDMCKKGRCCGVFHSRAKKRYSKLLQKRAHNSRFPYRYRP